MGLVPIDAKESVDSKYAIKMAKKFERKKLRASKLEILDIFGFFVG